MIPTVVLSGGQFAALMQLAAGTASIGKLAANSGVDIGDVDILSIAAGNNNIGDVDIASGTITTVSTVTNLSQMGGVAIALNTGVRSTGTQRVTIATDDIVPTKELPDATATYAPTNASTTAYAASLIIKASAGVLFCMNGYNSRTSSQFIQVHNTASLPADAQVPVITFTVPASANFSIDFGRFGRYFSTGITVCNSSTGATKTIGSADIWADCQYQ